MSGDRPTEKTDEAFLARWSRRKVDAREEETEAKQAKEANLPQPAATAPPQSPSDQEKTEPAELPPVESLTQDSDYSVFLRDGVPAEIQRAALRKLWMSDPVASRPEPLDIHAFDYNAVPTFPEGIKSAWEAGKGYLNRLVEEAGKPGADGGATPPEPEKKDAVAQNAADSGSEPEAAKSKDG